MEELSKGQPLKLLKPGVQEKFLQALGRGATYNIASGYAGITYKTFREWMKRGEPLADLFEEQIEIHPDKCYYDFYCLVKRTEAYAALKWLEKIDAASDFHWQAAAWKLERRHPNEYGKVTYEAEKNTEDSSIEKAKSEVDRLKGDDHGRSAATTD